MPSYDYEVQDAETGETLARLTLIRSVAQRDAIVFRRVQVPKRINVALGPTEGERRIATDMRNFYKEEQRVGADFEHHFGGYSKEQIREIWSQPEAAPATSNEE